MKFRWLTPKIETDLAQLPYVKGVRRNAPGGDYDTEVVIVEVEDSPDRLWVRGFVTDDGGLESTHNVDVDMIELTDGLQDDHGLTSNNQYTALVYVSIRQYFIDKGAEVVQSMDGYF